jgi:hypothetical protein
MMKKFFLPFLLLAFFQKLDAQTGPERAIVTFQPHQLNRASLRIDETATLQKATALGMVPLENTGPFLAYSIVWYSNDWDENSQMTAIFSSKTTGLHTQQISPESHAETVGYRHVSELYFLENDAQKFRIHYTGKASIDSIEVHFFNPGFSVLQSGSPSVRQPESSEPTSGRSACTCPQPLFQGRNDWCPNGNCPTDPTPVSTTVNFLIVHHSAGTNSSSDWAAVVRSIWDFHVNVNGWDDIGYNWLVDPNGVLYEGRGDNKLGAHFCGTNAGTMGVCVMGDFTNIQPTGNAVGTLSALLAWKSCDADLEPLGSGFHASSGLTLNRISGHRDGVCSTSCPGDSFYPLLPAIRLGVHDFIENGCTTPVLTAPSQLTATLIDYNKIELEWKDNSTAETGFVLERSKSFNNNYQVIATLPPNTIGFTDLGVEPLTGYFYRVKAVTGSTPSGYSNEVFIATGATAAGERGLSEKTVVVSPNPAAGFVSVSIENQWFGKTEVSVFDAMGRQAVAPVFFEKNAGTLKFELNLHGYPAGVFWLKLGQGGEVGFFKILKK